ncbi:centromere protein P isoform X1 [Apteryx rowi]|uniref:Centromere protein P n=1 Tax=Apteryx owenii TaxID=8824 RepID=A0A8B9QBZ4_APTOW|nr:PREDICTED: centromere protein P [Apteryx mantelli mantelli]XP_025916945.1 centromere protein P isoform X1 [Apteryx rowi]XP_025916946.1 centromere protein P isoform X1 [Apteryx rowi]XP_025916947.1 centromere protein P isoform X1 [Apteryx rowi]
MENSIYQVYEDEIQSLEEEIKMLAEKYEDSQQESTFFSDEEILMSMKSFQTEFQGELKGQESPSDLKAQLESLETDLSFLMKFTGIWFTSHSKKTVEKTGSRTIQKHRLSGNCHSLPFQLEFQLLEIKSKESVSAVITDLNVIMESGEYSGVSKFVSSTEEHGNLLPFFRSLSSYAEWYEHRRCTFLHFKTRYPDIVKLPEGLLGDYIVLRNPEPSGFELMIVWKIHVDEDGRTTPVLDLLTKVPEQVLEQNITTIENAPTCFRSMLLLFGIETAIENLIKVVGLKK